MAGSKFWACLAKPLLLFHQHVKLCASSAPSTPGNAILTHSQPRSLCPPSSYTEVVTTILAPGETPTAQGKLQSPWVILRRGGIFQIMIISFKRECTELHRYSPFYHQKAHKGLTNLYCLFYGLISPLPYLATSSLSPGISSPFPSQSWGLFLPRLSSTGSSPSLTTAHIPVFVLAPTALSVWTDFTFSPDLLLSYSSKLVEQVFIQLPSPARMGSSAWKLRRAHEHQAPGEQGLCNWNPR